ncbi:MAG TPA: hypothetical protein VFN94_10030 [Nitrospiria bacterium]|nr:hypothetical protein [Nitrospiria bacterium]
MEISVPVDRLSMGESEMEREVLPLLVNQVFHVTSYERYLKIAESGHISHNADDRHGHIYGQSLNSIGRKLKAVCLFDLRNKDLTSIEFELGCYHLPTVPQFGRTVTFLFLKTSEYARLVQWDSLDSNDKMSGQHIPKIESWYPGDLVVSKLSKVLIVDVDRPVRKGSAELLADLIERTGWQPGPQENNEEPGDL